jgi:hypothetical protein
MPNYLPALMLLAATSAIAGATDQARNAAARIRELDARWCLSRIEKRNSYRRPEQIARMLEGLRKAGLPE